MTMIGLVNIVKCGCAPARAAGPLAPLFGLGAAAAVGVVGYHALESVLVGLQASAHEANVALAWAAGAIGVVIALGFAVWLLIGRRREVAQRPAVADHDAAMLAATQRQALAAPRTTARVEARRMERIGTER